MRRCTCAALRLARPRRGITRSRPPCGRSCGAGSSGGRRSRSARSRSRSAAAPAAPSSLSDPDVAPLRGVRCAPGGERRGRARCRSSSRAGRRPAITEPTAVGAGRRSTIADVELELLDEAPADPDPELDEELAAALGSDGPHADDDLMPVRERRRVKRATALALGALARAARGRPGAGRRVRRRRREPTSTSRARARRRAVDRPRPRARDRPEGSGTGWVLDAKDGLIVTNFHVVNGASELRGRGRGRRARGARSSAPRPATTSRSSRSRTPTA